MRRMLEIDFAPDERKLRQFGLIACVAFGFLAVSAWHEMFAFRHGLGPVRSLVAALFAALATFSLVAAALRPKLGWGIYIGLSLLAYPFGLVISYLIMGTLFYGLITPVGLLFRSLGRDPLTRAFEPRHESYWSEPNHAESDESYFRQF